MRITLPARQVSKKFAPVLRFHPPPECFRAQYSRTHDPNLNYFHLNKPQVSPEWADCHPRPDIASRPRDCLWWSVIAFSDVSLKSTIRRYCKRRVQVAFADGLRARGFDGDGRLLETASSGGLRGSLKLVIMPDCLIKKRADIDVEVGMLIDRLIMLSMLNLLTTLTQPLTHYKRC